MEADDIYKVSGN